jgi:hypothetical protein
MVLRLWRRFQVDSWLTETHGYLQSCIRWLLIRVNERLGEVSMFVDLFGVMLRAPKTNTLSSSPSSRVRVYHRFEFGDDFRPFRSI